MENEKIIDLALKLYAKKGVEATSFREIARHAGVGASLLSYRFGSKKGLASAVISSRILKKTNELGLVLTEAESCEDFENKLMTALESLVGQRFKNPDETAVIDELLRDPELLKSGHPVAEQLKNAYSQLELFFEKAIHKGYVKGFLSVKTLSFMVASMVRDSAYNHECNLRLLNINNASIDTRKAIFESFVRLISNG